MKFILEINTEFEKDIVEAIETLIKIAPKDLNLSTNKNLIEQNKEVNLIQPAEGIDFNVLSDITCGEVGLESNNLLEEEIKELKSVIDELKAEKNKLIEENKALKDNVNSLRDELNAMPSIPCSENSDVDTENYKNKIEQLTKEVSFHENRSNKNFEEVKKLRNSLDNIAAEKRALEKNVAKLEEELSNAKLNGDGNNGNSAELLEKIEEFEKTTEKLSKEVEFHKNRSNKNWDELKVLRQEYENVCKENADLTSKIKERAEDLDSSNSKEELNKIKSELAQVKSECDNKLGDMQIINDKLISELNSYKSKFSEEDLSELAYLRKIKQVICNNDKGAAFWMGVESTLK